MSFKNAMMIQPSSRLASVATARLRSTPCHRRRDTSTAATTVSNDTRILATQKWLDNIVIGQKLCPFAPSVRSAPQLRLRVSSSVNEDSLVKEVAVEARILVGKDNRSEKYHPRPETTLLVLNEDIYPEMSDFRNLVKASWRLQAESLVDNGFASDLQIVLFHPLAKHDTYADPDDCADFTIRSPHAMVHLLREADVLRGVQGGYKDLEGLPSRNKAKMRKEGFDTCLRRLELCRTNLGTPAGGLGERSLSCELQKGPID